MGRKHFQAEQIIHNLREAEVELSKGQTTVQVCKKLGICEALLHDSTPARFGPLSQSLPHDTTA